MLSLMMLVKDLWAVASTCSSASPAPCTVHTHLSRLLYLRLTYTPLALAF